MRFLTKEDLYHCVQKYPVSDPAFRVWTLMFGEHKSKQIGEGIEFKEFRPYEPGEDTMGIDVEASPRLGEPMVREDLSEEKVRYAIVFDYSASLYHYGLREASLIAIGSCAISATASKDAVRIIVLGGATPYISSAIYTVDDVIASLFEIWDLPKPESGRPTTLEECSNESSRLLKLSNTRILFVSDFQFKDVRAVYDRKKEKFEIVGREILQQAVGGTHASGGQSVELAFLGISPVWDDFLGLRGLVRFEDSEDGSRGFVRFTKRKAKKFVAEQYERETVWQESTRSFGVPMSWVHAGEPESIIRELEQGFM